MQVLFSSVYIVFFIGTAAVRHEYSFVCQNLLWLVSSVYIVFFIGIAAVRH